MVKEISFLFLLDSQTSNLGAKTFTNYYLVAICWADFKGLILLKVGHCQEMSPLHLAFHLYTYRLAPSGERLKNEMAIIALS